MLLASSFVHAEESDETASDIKDRIEVTGQLPSYQTSLSKVLPQQTVVDDTSFSSDSLATLLSQAPAINLNGQGGLFQTVNIRGFARWRIQTLVEGIPVYTERRAGTSVEFLPPSFIGQAYLTQGAASTQLGSGAIGGGLDLNIDVPQENQLKLGYGFNQDYRDITAKGALVHNTGQDSFSWMLNHRHANNSEDGSGEVIQDKFEHNSFTLRNRSSSGFVQDSFLMYSSANNIAKASADDPADRFTIYPENTHVLGKIVLDWHHASFYFHDAKLITDVTRPGSRINISQNDSLDLGVQLNDKFQIDNWLFHWRAGIDARTGVEAFERELSIQGIEAFARLNLDAEQWESSVSGDFSREYKNGIFIGGARLAYQYQDDKLSDQSQNDTNVSAFIGYGHQLNDTWQWSGYISNAYRVPSLTERYFNGTTPRGTVLGDADLETETAINIETSLAYETDDVSFSVSVFQQDINDYIERLRISADLRQYRNLESAEISGVNYQLQYEFDYPMFQTDDLHWKINMGGQWLNGEDQDGNAVADISPAQHRFSVSAFGEASNGFIAMTYRQSSDEIVSGELPTDSVTTIDAGYTHQLNEKMQISLNVTNLTNNHYVTSRDDLAPFARGRDVHLSLGMSF